jgi:predicted transcriptional regulator
VKTLDKEIVDCVGDITGQIRGLMKEQGMTLTEMARYLGTTKENVYGILNRNDVQLSSVVRMLFALRKRARIVIQ